MMNLGSDPSVCHPGYPLGKETTSVHETFPWATEFAVRRSQDQASFAREFPGSADEGKSRIVQLNDVALCLWLDPKLTLPRRWINKAQN